MAHERNNDHFDLTIPFRPYLKKYIAASRSVEPFVLKLNKCHFSGLILGPIKKGYVPKRSSDCRYLTDRLVIRMTSSVQRENKFTIDNQTIRLIDERMKNLFEEHLYATVSMNLEKNSQIKEKLLQFLTYYNITEDDLKLETVIKMFYRARKAKTKEELSESIDSKLIYYTSNYTENGLVNPFGQYSFF